MICPKCGNEHIPSTSPTTGCCVKAEQEKDGNLAWALADAIREGVPQRKRKALWLCPNCGCCHHENAEKCIRAIASERDDLKEKLERVEARAGALGAELQGKLDKANAYSEALPRAAHYFDWGQPGARWEPCFHLESDGHFCGRAQGWAGHADGASHEFVKLSTALRGMKV